MSKIDKMTGKDLTNAIHFTEYRLQTYSEELGWQTHSRSGNRRALIEEGKASGYPWRLQFDADPLGWTTCLEG